MSHFGGSMAAQELFKVVFVSGGSMELGSASNKLSSPSKHEISRKYGKISAMVSQFPEYFTLTKEGRTRHLVEVRLPSSMEFCRDAGKKTGCQDRNCPDLHLCTHFLVGTCTYGEKCRKSHSVGDVHTRRILCRAGLEFLLENTARLESLLRQKATESAIETTAVNRDDPETCKHYNRQSGCSRGDDCLFLHVCSHYVDGDCKFKESCKRSHNFSDPHSKKVLKAIGYDRLSGDQILRILKGLKPDRVRTVSVGTSPSSVQPAYGPNLSRSMSNCSLSTTSSKDEPDICGFHLRGKCNYGDHCKNCHAELPYLWEYRRQGVSSWEAASDDLNVMIEEAFCEVTTDSFSVTLGKNQCSIVFDDMIAKPRQASTAHPLELRRLSTVSSVEAPPGHIYSTKWRWYWKDENGKWQSYDCPDDGHAAGTASSETFEKNFQSGKTVHPFSAGKHKYTMQFDCWVQQNDVYKTQRAVRRRPVFVSREGMADILKRKRALGAQAAASAHSEPSLPTHWDPMDSSNQEFQRVTLQTISDEYKRALKLFGDTIPSHRIIKIERVQNPDTWMEYVQKKQRMTKKAGGTVLEKRLFHGTSPETVDAICQQGFDWRMCGKHGTAYGQGSYFASTAAYSNSYAKTSVTCVKQMFLARVLVGSYAVGSSSYKRPPPKDQAKTGGELYDSCVDNTASPGLYVIFENGQSYPEILITYVA